MVVLVLLSTHIVSDIEYIANEILLMQNGRIVHAGALDEILREVPVRAWSLTVPKGEVNSWQERYQVSNLKTLPQGVALRVLSGQKPTELAVEEELTLEDVFLYYFDDASGIRAEPPGTECRPGVKRRSLIWKK